MLIKCVVSASGHWLTPWPKQRPNWPQLSKSLDTSLPLTMLLSKPIPEYFSWPSRASTTHSRPDKCSQSQKERIRLCSKSRDADFLTNSKSSSSTKTRKCTRRCQTFCRLISQTVTATTMREMTIGGRITTMTGVTSPWSTITITKLLRVLSKCLTSNCLMYEKQRGTCILNKKSLEVKLIRIDVSSASHDLFW